MKDEGLEEKYRKPRAPVALRLAHGILVHGQQFEEGAMNKTAFLENSGRLSNSQVNRLLALDEKSLVNQYMETSENGAIRFRSDLGMAVGISLGSESLRAGLFDCNGNRRAEVTFTNEAGRFKQRPDAILGYIRDITHDLLEEALKDDSLVSENNGGLPLLGVAVAWPAPIHRIKKKQEGKILHRDWNKSDLTERVAETLHLEAERSHAINDANAAALSVAFDESRAGAPPENEDTRAPLIMTLRNGGGIGAGTVILEPYDEARSAFIDASLIEGATGMAGELGHLRIDEAFVTELNEDCPDGIAELSMDWRCSCGKKGHLEAMASGTAMVRRIKESDDLDEQDIGLLKGRRRSHARQMSDIMTALKDPRALGLVRDSGRLIGHALASPILMLNPRKIVLTGSLGIPALRDGILDMEHEWRSEFGPAPEVICAEREGDADNFMPARGAALAVLRNDVYRRFKTIFGYGNTKDLVKPITGKYVKQLERDRKRKQSA